MTGKDGSATVVEIPANLGECELSRKPTENDMTVEIFRSYNRELSVIIPPGKRGVKLTRESSRWLAQSF